MKLKFRRAHRARPTQSSNQRWGALDEGASVGHFLTQGYNSPMALMLSNNRMVGGVCGGLAEWLGWDPTLVRILYTILTIFTAFSGLIVYLVLWIIMPRKS